jgi:hypothetical protein
MTCLCDLKIMMTHPNSIYLYCYDILQVINFNSLNIQISNIIS